MAERRLAVGDRVVIDVTSQQPDDPSPESYRGPGVVDQVYPRGCFVAVGENVPALWWLPRRNWDTTIVSVEPSSET